MKELVFNQVDADLAHCIEESSVMSLMVSAGLLLIANMICHIELQVILAGLLFTA